MNTVCLRRVLHLRSSGGLLGAENVIVEISKFSSEFGYKSIVGAINNVQDSYPDFLNLASEYGIDTVLFKSDGRIDFKCVKKIKKYIVDNKIDIVHTHGYKENVFCLLSKSSCHTIATNHLWKGNTLKSHTYCFIDSILIRFFDKTVGVSDEIVKHMKKLRIKDTAKIANGVDTVKFCKKTKSPKVMAEFGLSSDNFVMGMISSLTHEKNHKIIIEALRSIEVDQFKLLIVGDGELRDELRMQVAKAGLNDCVIFVGTQNNIAEVLSTIDVFLLPSLLEGLPMALLEAMACEKAVIASRVGEVPNVIRHENNGLLVEPDDLRGIIDAIKLFSGSRELIAKYGKSARNTVEELYSSRRMSQDYCNLYDSFY